MTVIVIVIVIVIKSSSKTLGIIKGSFHGGHKNFFFETLRVFFLKGILVMHADGRTEVVSDWPDAELFRIGPLAQLQRTERSRLEPSRLRIAAAVLVLGACLVATIVLVLGGSQNDDLGGRRSWEKGMHLNAGPLWQDVLARGGHREPTEGVLSGLAKSLNFDYNPFGSSTESARHRPAGVGIREIARSSVNLPPEKATYVDSNPGVPAIASSWGPSKPGPNLPGTLGDQAHVTTMGGATASGSWEAETCVDPPCGLGLPQPELSDAGSGDNPGPVAGWLGRQAPRDRDKHMRMSSAGPGFLGRIPRPQPVSSSSYMMSRHLHYVLFQACEDAETSLEGTAACVRRNGKSVQQALKYLMWGPSARERESALGASGLFAGRMFQRYLKSDPYLIGEDWPRSVLRFPDHEHEKTHSFAVTMQKAEVTGPCSHFSIAHGTALDTSAADPSWIPIQGSSSASVVNEEQCCSLCLYHKQCRAWQLEEPGFCRLLMPTSDSRGRIPLTHDQYSQVGLLIAPPASTRGSQQDTSRGRINAGQEERSRAPSGDGGGDDDGGSGVRNVGSPGGERDGERTGSGSAAAEGAGGSAGRDNAGSGGSSAGPGAGDQGTPGGVGRGAVAAVDSNTGEYEEEREGTAAARGSAGAEAADGSCTWVQSDGNSAGQEHAGFAHSREECVALVTQRCPDASMASLPVGGIGSCRCQFGPPALQFDSSSAWMGCILLGQSEVLPSPDGLLPTSGSGDGGAGGNGGDSGGNEGIGAGAEAEEPADQVSVGASEERDDGGGVASATSGAGAGEGGERLKWSDCAGMGGVKGNYGGKEGQALCCHADCKQCGKDQCMAANQELKLAKGDSWILSNCCRDEEGDGRGLPWCTDADPMCKCKTHGKCKMVDAAAVRGSREGKSSESVDEESGITAPRAAGTSQSARDGDGDTKAGPPNIPQSNFADISPETAARIGINLRCYTPDGEEMPCIEDHQPCGDDGSGQGPEEFDSTCRSNQCGWACTEAPGANLLTSVLGCVSCDNGQCRCVAHELEHFVRKLNGEAS